MALSSDLVSQFAKITKPETKPSEGTVVTGTAKEYDGDIYVQLDGSEQLTPIASSTAGIKDGDRVTVLIKSHTATVTGNVSDPSASQGTVSDIEQNVSDQISEFEIVIADKVSTDQLEAESARIDELVAENVTIKETLTAESAKISDLEADNVTINGKLEAAEADIDSLSTSKLDASVASITYAKIGDLEAISGEFHTLESDYATFKETTTDTLEANSADIDQIKADMITVDDFDAKYANIDFANIGEAAIEKLFSDSGIIGDLVMSDGHVTGTLVGVTIKGDLIEGNTIVADKLVIKGEDGLFYKLNTDGVDISAEQTEYNSLNGSVITAHSITAEKVNVDDLVAFNATIGGFHITDDSIYSGVKSSATNTTRGVFMNDDGEFSIGDAANYLKFFKDTDGTYKLDISAASIRFGSDSTNLETAIGNITATVEEVHNASALIHEADGGVIDCGDTAGMPLAGLTVYGQTRQNLWMNPSGTSYGATITANANGSISMSGSFSGSASSAIRVAGIYNLKPSTEYTLSVDKILYPETNDPVGFGILQRNSSGVWLNETYAGYGNVKEVTFTTSPNMAASECLIFLRVGETFTEGTYRVMLNEGSTAEPWCPPGLNSVEDVTVWQSGKNLYNADGFADINNISVDNGVITVDAGFNGWDTTNTIGTFIPKGTKVSIKKEIISGESNVTANFGPGLFLFDSAGQHVLDHDFSVYGTYNERTDTLPEDVYAFTAYINAKPSGEVKMKVQFEIADAPTEFEPANLVSTPIDLLGNKVSSLPDGTRDELVVDAGGNVVLTKNVYEITATSSSPWATKNDYAEIVLNDAPFERDMDSSMNNQFNDKLPVGNPYNVSGYPCAWAFYSTQYNASATILRAGGESLNTAEKVKSLCGTSGMHHYYARKASARIPLGTVDLPDLPEQNAHVWISTSTQGLDPDIHATWYAENASALKDFASKAELKVESDQIKATVEETYSTKEEVSAVEDKADAAQDALDSYKNTVSTTYATKSEVTQTANSIKSEVSEIYTTKEEFEGLEVGGRNLLLESDTPNRSYSSTSYPAASYPIVEDSIIQGEKYTWSVNGTFTDAATIAVYFTGGTVGTPFQPIPGDGTHTISWTFTANANMVANDTRVDIYVRDSRNTPAFNGTAVIHWAKLERGTKATDWSPAPEDMLSTSDAQATYATKTSVSTVEQTVDSLTSTVSSNYTTLNNKFGNYYTKTQVDQKDSSIKSTVSEVQTTANNALTKATTVEQTADGLEVRLTQAEKDVDTAQTTANAAKKQLYHSAGGTSGTAGYVKFAQIKISFAYMNRPIYFSLSNRGQAQSNVWIQFGNSSSTDPPLSSIKADGGINVYIYKSATSTWDVVAQKSESYDTVFVNDYSNNNSGVTVSWTNVQLSSVSGYTAATRLAAKRESSDIDDAAKTATNYLKFDSTGLVVGNHTTTLTGNTQITSSGMNIRNGSTTLASFTADSVELGKNSNSASVELCNGAMSFTRSGSSFGYLSASVDTFEILANNITLRGGLYAASTAIVNSTLTLNAGMTVNGTTFGATVIGDVFRHGAQLYNSSSGTFGTVTLSSSVTNYNEIVIFPALSDGVRIAAVRLRVSNNTSFDIVSAACGDGWWNICRGRWTMSGNKLNAVSGANGIMQSGNVWQSGSGIKILRVVAYH